MSQSPRIDLTFLLPSQAQKTISVNESFHRLDALVQMVVHSRSEPSPSPADPLAGYVLTGPLDGMGRAGDLAFWQDGRWAVLTPRQGWRTWVRDEARECVWTGSEWVPSAPVTDVLPQLGINTQADATSKLAVKSDAVLLSHDDVTPGSGDMRLVLNRAGPQSVASLIFQTAFSGEAEFGLSGAGDVVLRVSPDGSSFLDALRVDRATGACDWPGTPRGLLGIRHFGVGTHVYNPPPQVRTLRLTAIGAGGGGAGAETLTTSVFVGAGGGGAGGVVITAIDARAVGSLTLSVGAGGSGGSAPDAAAVGSRNGGAGSQTEVTGTGVSLLAGGGGGALEDSATSGTSEFTGGSGGSASGGQINLPGQQGGGGVTRASQFYQIGSGEGASGLFGIGGAYRNGDGRSGMGFGSGGSGCGMIPGVLLNRRGGAGAPGAVIIEEFA